MAIPYSGVYAEQETLAQRAYEDALSRIKSQQQKFYQQSGYNYDVTNKGEFTNIREDPTSQYGGIQQMRRQQGQDLNATRFASAARGFKGPGLAAQGESDVRYQQGAQTRQFGLGLIEGGEAFSQERLAALRERNERVLAAQAGSRNEAIQNELWEKFFGPTDSNTDEENSGGSGESSYELASNYPSGKAITPSQFLSDQPDARNKTNLFKIGNYYAF